MFGQEHATAPSPRGVSQRECRLAAKASERYRRCPSTYEMRVTSDKLLPNPAFLGTKV